MYYVSCCLGGSVDKIPGLVWNSIYIYMTGSSEAGVNHVCSPCTILVGNRSNPIGIQHMILMLIVKNLNQK